MQYYLLLYFFSILINKSTAILPNNKFFRQIDSKQNPYSNKYNTEKKISELFMNDFFKFCN